MHRKRKRDEVLAGIFSVAVVLTAAPRRARRIGRRR